MSTIALKAFRLFCICWCRVLKFGYWISDIVCLVLQFGLLICEIYFSGVRFTNKCSCFTLSFHGWWISKCRDNQKRGSVSFGLRNVVVQLLASMFARSDVCFDFGFRICPLSELMRWGVGLTSFDLEFGMLDASFRISNLLCCLSGFDLWLCWV